ncbi:MAG: hypothetical protein GX574_09750 [Lentisphaerae bacterium]|nr:hypothetical protein [Lentisphaerota bacterium]OQC15022.1 MAG: phosphodiesterase YaeI [Lentisphaerae bacterium ADurb.Bin082]
MARPEASSSGKVDEALVRSCLTRWQCICRSLCPLLAAPVVWLLRLVWPPKFAFRAERLDGSALRPPAGALRVLHASDLHLSQGRLAVRRLRRVVEAAHERGADLAVLTGDFELPISVPRRVEVMGLLSELCSLMPTYACLGNHDYKIDQQDLLRDLRQCGVVVLVNEAVTVTINGQELRLVGVGDFWKSDLAPEKCLSLKEDDNAWAVPTLLLVHNPDAILMYLQKFAWTVAFSGHAHGGQLRVPFTNWYPLAPIRHNYLARPGLHEIAPGQTLCESAGVGNFLGIRINSQGDAIFLSIDEPKQ